MKIKLYSYVIFRECDTIIRDFASENARDQDLRRHCGDWPEDGRYSGLPLDDLVKRYEDGTDCRVHLREDEIDIPELTTAARVMDSLIEWDHQQGQYEANCWNELRLARKQLRKLEA